MGVVLTFLGEWSWAWQAGSWSRSTQLSGQRLGWCSQLCIPEALDIGVFEGWGLTFNQTLNKENYSQVDLKETYRIFQKKNPLNNILSSHNFSKLDHTLGHKAILNRYKNTEAAPCILWLPWTWRSITTEMAESLQIHGSWTAHHWMKIWSKQKSRGKL